MSIDDHVKSRKAVFLFYKDFEADKFVKNDRYLKRFIRPLYNVFHSRQKKTGFKVSFEALLNSLKLMGLHVYVNDYAAAARHRHYPVGIVGFPLILDDWKLNNPALLGPSLYDHPGLCLNLFDNPAFKKYLVLGDWTYDMFSKWYGPERCVKWFAGIDLLSWPDESSEQKQVDFIVYDKIRWDRHILVPHLLDRITSLLLEKRLTFEVVKYKQHDHASFKQSIKNARAMIFLCEHETQGIAYQEALASNLPVFAWDPGYWADPLWKVFSNSLVPASSVPFFADECGMCFRNFDDFTAKINVFLDNIQHFAPRSFVEQRLSQFKSADIYWQTYISLIDSSET